MSHYLIILNIAYFFQNQETLSIINPCIGGYKVAGRGGGDHSFGKREGGMRGISQNRARGLAVMVTGV